METPKRHDVHGGIDVGQWPGPLDPRTYSGKSVYFLAARAVALIVLCIYAWKDGSTVVFALAVAAFIIDVGHTAIGTAIQLRGLELQGWIKKLVAGDLDFRVEAKGDDEIAMYARVLEALRSSMEEARRLDARQRKLSAELTEALEKLKATQDQIVSQQKLAELGELSAGVAHEIRNPLQFVKNFAEVSVGLVDELKELLGEPPSETTRAEIAEVAADLSGNMARIVNHSERANRIVSDMLSLRRDTERAMRPVALNALVHEQAMLAYHAARSDQPELAIVVEEDFDEAVGEVNAVANDLGRVVINLVSNACQAISEKAQGAGEGYGAKLRVATRSEAAGVLITVRDNGVGMSEAVREKMFTPFFTTKQGRHGTGLGMSLSHDIVRAHGGTLQAESREGEYTEMRVTLPAADGPRP